MSADSAAVLGLKVEVSGLSQATNELNKLSSSAHKAENATAGLSSVAANAVKSFDAEASAVNAATSAVNLHAKAANQNNASMNLAASGASKSGYQMRMMAMQLSQVAQQTSATGNFMQALAIQLPDLALGFGTVGIAIGVLAGILLPLIDGPKLAANSMYLLADAVEYIGPYALAAAAALTLMYAPQLIAGVASLTVLMYGLAASAARVGASFALAWVAATGPVGLVIAAFALVASAAVIFRDDLTQLFGVDIVGAAKSGVNAIIGGFVGGYEAIKTVWSQLPAALGDLVMSTANAVITGVENMINKVGAGINSYIQSINSAMKSLPFGMGDNIKIGNVGAVSLGRVENPYAGAGNKAEADAGKAIKQSMSKDYLGDMGTSIANGASNAAGKLRELAGSFKSVEEASGKAKGGGGQSEEDVYARVVQSANERIASLKAEQSALGMTAEAASKLRTEQQLINQVQGVGKNIKAGQREELGKLAGEMARVEAETKRAKEQMDFAKGATKGFLSDLRSGLAQGKSFFESFGQAASNVLDKIISKIEDQLVDALFSIGGSGKSGGGGGLFGSILGGIGSLFGFASGGYTGGGSASSVAGVVHGGEYVFSKKATDRIGVGNLEAMHRSAKGYAAGGYVPPSNQNNGSQQVSVQVGVTVDNEGSIKAYVKSVTTKEVQAAAPKIVAASRQQIMPTIADYQSKTAGGDYRG